MDSLPQSLSLEVRHCPSIAIAWRGVPVTLPAVLHTENQLTTMTEKLEIEGRQYSGIDCTLVNDEIEVVPELVLEARQNHCAEAVLGWSETSTSHGKTKHLSLVEPDAEVNYLIEGLVDKATTLGGLEELVSADGTVTVLSDTHEVIEGTYRITAFGRGDDYENKAFEGTMYDESLHNGEKRLYLRPFRLTLVPVEE